MLSLVSLKKWKSDVILNREEKETIIEKKEPVKKTTPAKKPAAKKTMLVTLTYITSKGVFFLFLLCYRFDDTRFCCDSSDMCTHSRIV